MSCTGTSGKFNSTLSLCLRENCAPAFSNNFDGLLLYSYAVIQLHYCYTADCTSFPLPTRQQLWFHLLSML